MSSIIFVLGAGASKQCGGPLMADFLDTASHLLNTGATEDKKEDFERVFRAIGALQAVHSKAQLDLTNIESVFTAFEIANVLGKLPKTEATEIPRIISSLKKLIVKTLELTIDFPTYQNQIRPPEPYGKFAELLKYLRENAIPTHTVSVITFNYDIALDRALHWEVLGPDYGIPPQTKIHNPIPLFKLHGSLNWATLEETGEVYPLLLEDYFTRYSVSFQNIISAQPCKIPIGSQLKSYFAKYTDKKVAEDPVIVPPTWNKADHQHALSKVWSKAAQHLGEAEYIFIIGYSLPETDAFFRLLYALGTVGEKPLRNIVVYNPDESPEVKERFKRMLGPGALARYEYKTMIFEQAILDIQNYFQSKTHNWPTV